MDRIPALHTPRMFAVIPAAGLSRRMGRPKLLLSLGGQTIMARLVQAVQASEVSRTVVVARSDDAGLHTEVTNAGGCLVIPESDPPDMRTSVEHALDWPRMLAAGR